MQSIAQSYTVKGLNYTIRNAIVNDAKQLPKLRCTIDGETEFLDRVQGEGYIDEAGFVQLIKTDTEKVNHLFLVAEVEGRLVGFARCQGSDLRRFLHKVEFGVCILKDYWGYRIGSNLLEQCIQWADCNGIKKITLTVVETNKKAIELYKKHRFEIEGILRKDRLHADGKYYNTIIMARHQD